MALKYVASNTTYDFGKSEYTTTSNKYKRLNYIANGKTYQLGLATDSTATQYSPLKMKINDSTYYIGRSSSRSASTSSISTYSSCYLAVNTYTNRYTASSIKTIYVYLSQAGYSLAFGPVGDIHHAYDITRELYVTSDGHMQPTWYTYYHSNGGGESYTYFTTYKFHRTETEIATYTRSESKTSNEYSTTTASSSTSNVTTISSDNFV